MRIAGFRGEIPRLIPRLLPQNGAQIAQDVLLDSGSILPYREPSLSTVLGADAKTIFRLEDEWLSWPGVVDVVPGPIADDRLYITGDGAPKLRVDGMTYPLALHPPTTALEAVSIETIAARMAAELNKSTLVTAVAEGAKVVITGREDGQHFRIIPGGYDGITVSGQQTVQVAKARDETIPAAKAVGSISISGWNPIVGLTAQVVNVRIGGETLLAGVASGQSALELIESIYLEATAPIPHNANFEVTWDGATAELNITTSAYTSDFNGFDILLEGGDASNIYYTQDEMEGGSPGESYYEFQPQITEFTLSGTPNGSSFASVLLAPSDADGNLQSAYVQYDSRNATDNELLAASLTISTYIYTYTYVTEFDEESAPAPSSKQVLLGPDQDLRITGFAAPPAGRAIDRIRLYRSQTSTSGETDFYFIAEFPAATSSFDDNITDNPIQEPLPSLYYDPPPDGLEGVIALPNGMLAAFQGKSLYFSEPWQPHAWPERYILTTEFPIVGLGAYGSNVVLATAGHPYIAQGTAPETMVMERIEVNLPCLSKAGVVDLGYAVAYPTSDGLVVVSGAGARVVTSGLFTREQWQALEPTTMIASHYDGRYILSHPAVAKSVSVSDGRVEPDGYLPQTKSHATATARAFKIIDLSGETPDVVRSATNTDTLWHEPGTGNLFYVEGGTSVRQWDSGGEPYREMLWRSRLNHLPGHTNYGCILVEGDDLGSQGDFEASVFADGVLVAQISEMNTPKRLPSGFLALKWEVEVKGRAQITAISLASSPSDLVS